MEEIIEFEVRLDRSADEAWALVTDPEALGTWMLGAFEFEARLGATLVFRSDDQVRRGEVIEVEHRRRLTWQWSDGLEESEVAITLDGDHEQCSVRIVERLLPPRRWAKPSIPPVEASVG